MYAFLKHKNFIGKEFIEMDPFSLNVMLYQLLYATGKQYLDKQTDHSHDTRHKTVCLGEFTALFTHL